jgi:hypothetical protein
MAIKGSKGNLGLKDSETRRLDGPRDKGLEAWRGTGEAMREGWGGDGEGAEDTDWGDRNERVGCK